MEKTPQKGVVIINLPKKVPYIQNPIVQPAFIHNQPATHSLIHSFAGLPQPSYYSTNLDPVFIQHLSRHQGQKIALVTTVGRVEGELAGVAVDHLQLNTEDRSLHIRLSQIIWFEGPKATYA